MVEASRGAMRFTNPLSRETYLVPRTCGYYHIPQEAFKCIKTMTPKQAAETLGLTRMSIHNLCARGVLQSCKVNGNRVISAESVYNELKRRKENPDG